MDSKSLVCTFSLFMKLAVFLGTFFWLVRELDSQIQLHFVFNEENTIVNCIFRSINSILLIIINIVQSQFFGSVNLKKKEYNQLPKIILFPVLNQSLQIFERISRKLNKIMLCVVFLSNHQPHYLSE